MITIKNTQRLVPINTAQLKKDAQIILDTLHYTDFDLGIWITTNKTIQKYNHQYRNKNKPTDILSFAYHPHLKGGESITTENEEDKNLGDLIIAPEYIQNDLSRWNQTLEERIKTLLVHGICHLLGYDHETDAEYAVMLKKERALLKKIL